MAVSGGHRPPWKRNKYAAVVQQLPSFTHKYTRGPSWDSWRHLGGASRWWGSPMSQGSHAPTGLESCEMIKKPGFLLKKTKPHFCPQTDPSKHLLSKRLASGFRSHECLGWEAAWRSCRWLRLGLWGSWGLDAVWPDPGLLAAAGCRWQGHPSRSKHSPAGRSGSSEWFSVRGIIYFWCQGGPGRLLPLAVSAPSIIDSSAPSPEICWSSRSASGMPSGVGGREEAGGFGAPPLSRGQWWGAEVPVAPGSGSLV